MFDPIEKAIYDTVHDFPGGAVKLAPRVNMNSGTLQNKADPRMEHQLTVREALAIQTTTGDVRILRAEAQVLGYVCIALGDFSGVDDIELLNAYAAWTSEIGSTAASIVEALADRRVTRREYEAVNREMFADAQRAFEFLARLEALIDD